MKHRVRRLLGSWTLMFALVSIGYGQTDSVMVVVPATQPQDTIPVNVLRAIFGMRLRTWPDGQPIRVFVLPDDHPVHTRFAKQVISIYPHQLRRAWDRLVFSGTGQAPTVVPSEEEMRRRVASTPGAIGYLPQASVGSRLDILEVR